ncbi:prepilin peptidase [Planctomycetaceae bacterium SH139]
MMDWWFNLIPLNVCAFAVFFDLRSREIPDWLPVVLVSCLALMGLVSESTMAIWNHAAGGVLSLIVGAVVGRRDRFGGGDIKLFAALGTWFGLFAVIPLALWIAIAGLPLAIFAAVRKQADFAYAPAIFSGVLVHVMAPDLLARIAT